MYQSFALEPSEAGSEIGSPRRRQFLELGLPEKGDDEDLTLLLSPPESSESMTRSQNSRGRSMYDSAIGADLTSSEEGSTCPKRRVLRVDKTNEFISYLVEEVSTRYALQKAGKFRLIQINDSPIERMFCSSRLYVLQESDAMSLNAPSCASLEWCDDIARNAPSRLGFDQDGSPIRTRRANLDWDLESEVEQAPLSIASSSLIREVEAKFAPKSSRDMMVMACEMFQPYSPPFADLQTIYHKRRLKRVAVPSLPDRRPESTVGLFMRSALYHKCALLREATWQTIEKVSHLISKTF
uniref:Uncharacterized protein n=1 Tax=Caenorhabditis japonica TaxID=281687 RepID=A0A8R1DY34_CAEJA